MRKLILRLNTARITRLRNPACHIPKPFLDWSWKENTFYQLKLSLDSFILKRRVSWCSTEVPRRKQNSLQTGEETLIGTVYTGMGRVKEMKKGFWNAQSLASAGRHYFPLSRRDEGAIGSGAWWLRSLAGHLLNNEMSQGPQNLLTVYVSKYSQIFLKEERRREFIRCFEWDKEHTNQLSAVFWHLKKKIQNFRFFSKNALDSLTRKKPTLLEGKQTINSDHWSLWKHKWHCDLAFNLTLMRKSEKVWKKKSQQPIWSKWRFLYADKATP